MDNRRNLASRILRLPSFRKQRTKLLNEQHKQNSNNEPVKRDEVNEGTEEEGELLTVVVREVETQIHQTKRIRELEEVGAKGDNDGDHQQQREGTGDGEWHHQQQYKCESENVNGAREWRTELVQGAEVEAIIERVQQLRQHSPHFDGKTPANVGAVNVELDEDVQRGEYGNSEEQKNLKINGKEEEEAQMAHENEDDQGPVEGIERRMETVHINNDLKEEVEKLQLTLRTMEEKLKNSNQERDYYKKHFKGENGGVYNGNGRGQLLTDDFGKELLMANKRKYQLENRTKQLELELRELHQRSLHLGESVKSMEKLLWLEKERSATLEKEREQLRGEVSELRRHGDALKRELAQLSGEEGVEGAELGGESHQEVVARLRDELEQRCNEMRDLKNKVEWRLGEVTQQFHDTKWRLGEVEATLAHRDWELEQANNRIKQLEASVAATPSATLSDELGRLKEEVAKKEEENEKMTWKFGEVTQWWNDAKWRVGELEAETAHRSHLLDRAHHRIGELERRLENNLSYEDLRREKETWEGRVTELAKTADEAKWRIGELEAELTSKRELEEQKRKLEWRLGEMTQWWNDAKWRVGELESALQINRKDGTEDKTLIVTLERLRELLKDGILLIRKQPHLNTHKWKLLKFEDTLSEDVRLVRCWFEANSDGHKEVFLIGNFMNWECALLCDQIPDMPSRRGIWLDLPPGRYEFRFLRDGSWHTEGKYGECWSEYGTKNNWINVG